MSSAFTTPSTTKLSEQIIYNEDAASFRERFNRISFMFSHNLVGHRLFEIPRLVKLADTIAATDVKYRVTSLASNVPAHVKWSDMKLNEQVAEAIEHINEAGSLVTIKSANLDPEYDALMQQILAELEELTGMPLRHEITWAEAYIFISSPHSVTPYHMDHEANFLFQIHGEKQVNLFDCSDREVLPEQEIERYFAGNMQAANYKQKYQSRANIYQLTPGKAIHHPSLAPHWVKNGDVYSVSLSINFCLRPVDLKAQIYQTNHFLRKLGLKPTPPGQSLIKDNAKISLISTIAKHQPDNKNDVVFSGINRINFALQAARRLKQLPKKALSQIPIISDYYRYHWCFPRDITVCRGIYKTFSDATQSLPANSRISHDQADIHDHSAISELTSCRTLGRLDPIDHPLLPWLQSSLIEGSTVFDFGGNVGVSYYAFQKHLQFPDTVQWIVCELPEIVKAGEKIAKEMNSQGLSFTTEFPAADGVDILLTCGALQYIEPSLAELLGQLKTKPKHLLINYVPFYNGESFVTLQNIGYAFSPYKIENRAEFIASLVSLGYELVDSWKADRTCRIPFHPECFADAYHGFYFRGN